MLQLESMKEFNALVSTIEKLRGKNGCPWDRAQTNISLKPYLIEETYEALQALDEGNYKKFCDELGDVLLQVVLHAQIAKEKKRFTISDVIKGIDQKMKRRHPHVFSGSKVKGVEEVWTKWEQIKKQEAATRSILDSIPKTLPALYKAEKTQKKAAREGFDWDHVAGAWEKVHEEMGEIEVLLRAKKSKTITAGLKEELGDLLFSVVNVSRKLGIDSEDALQAATKKFSKRFNYIEKTSKKLKKNLSDMTLDEMEELWKKAKNQM